MSSVSLFITLEIVCNFLFNSSLIQDCLAICLLFLSVSVGSSIPVFSFFSMFIKDINNSQSGARDQCEVGFPEVEKLAAKVVGLRPYNSGGGFSLGSLKSCNWLGLAPPDFQAENH